MKTDPHCSGYVAKQKARDCNTKQPVNIVASCQIADTFCFNLNYFTHLTHLRSWNGWISADNTLVSTWVFKRRERFYEVQVVPITATLVTDCFYQELK